MTPETQIKSALFNRQPNDKPYLISGPCSAETEEQVLETCQRLAATGKVQALRAGIWKPRTKPGGFEGVGAKGLPWLKKASELTGLPGHQRARLRLPPAIADDDGGTGLGQHLGRRGADSAGAAEDDGGLSRERAHWIGGTGRRESPGSMWKV